jgi:hypothetical protein
MIERIKINVCPMTKKLSFYGKVGIYIKNLKIHSLNKKHASTI